MENIKKLTGILMKNPLFAGVSEESIENLIFYFGVKTKIYQKGQYIMHAGELSSDFGIVISGKIKATAHSFEGKDLTYATIFPGDHFADVLAAAGKKESPVSLCADENNTEIINIPFRELITPCPEISDFQNIIIRNFFEIISMKYWGLLKKIEYMSVFPLKKRVCCFLLEESICSNMNKCSENGWFTLKFNRDGMASYLNSDRSALSRVLSSLRDSGIIEFYKSDFKISDEKKLRDIIK